VTSTTRTRASSRAPSAEPNCLDCGWAPEPGRLWPSEGRAGVRWIEANLICAEGDFYGQPIVLRLDQKRFLYRWYEYCGGCGRWRYKQGLRGAATGDGKSTFIAAIACLEFAGPPEIAPASPNVIIAAAAFDQANILYSMVATMLGGRDQSVPEAPLCGLFEVYDTKATFADGRPGKIQRIAAVAGTNEGGIPTLFIADELHEWGEPGSRKARLHVVVGKSTRKRRLRCQILDDCGEFEDVTRGPGRILNLSTAGFDVDHSLLGEMYQRGKRAELDPDVAPELLFDWQEAGDDLDFTNPEHRRIAVVAASAAAGILWDIEDRVRSWDEMPHHEWIRYMANKWVDVAVESWLKDHPTKWGECLGTWTVDGTEPTVLAIDMALRRDSVAVVETVLLADGRYAVRAKIWLPMDGRIDHADVFQYVKNRADDLGPAFKGFVYDPRFFELPAISLEEAGLLVIQFDQQPQRMAPAVGMTYDLILAKQLVHEDDPAFTRQVKAAVKREWERGFTLSKGKSRVHIDACVAMCMGVWSLATLEEQSDVLQQIW